MGSRSRHGRDGRSHRCDGLLTMTLIATKNGVPIIKDGKLATSCGCCAAPCLSSCPVIPQQITFSVSATSNSGDPFVDSGIFLDSLGLVIKRTNISFDAVDFSYVFDISRFLAQASGNLQVFRRLDGTFGGSVDHFGADIGGLHNVRVDWSSSNVECFVRFRASQIEFTMIRSDGSYAYTGYGFEERYADTSVSFRASGVSVSQERGWGGQRYASLGASGTPFEKFRRDYAVASPLSCLSYGTTPVESAQGVGGFPGPIFLDVSGFCLIPIPNPNDPPPEVGGEYGYEVGFISGCESQWKGNLRRVASSLGFAEVAIE